MSTSPIRFFSRLFRSARAISGTGIERLEDRIAPASILNLKLAKTGAFLTEDSKNAGANTVAVSMDVTGTLTIDPAADTQIFFDGTLLGAGDPVVLPGFTGGFVAKLGKGNDALTISGELPGAVTVDLGSDVNSLTFTAAVIGGKVTVKGGTDADTINFSGATTRIVGTVNLALGEGANVVNNATTTLLEVGGDFIAKGGKSVDDFLLAGADVHILGKVSLTTGASVAGVFRESAGFALTGSLTVDGDLVIKGSGLAGTRTDQTLNADAGISIGGALAMDLKAGQANQSVISLVSIFVAKTAKFTSGGKDKFGSVTLGSSSGAAAEMQIGGALTASTKNMDTEFRINAVAAGTLASGLTATGFTSFVGQLSGSIVGPVKVALAGPPGESGYFFLGTIVNAADPLRVGAVSVSTKTDDATMSLLGVIAQGTVKIKGSKGNDYFGADDTLFLAAATVDLGAGDDTFSIDNGNTPTGATEVNALLKLLGNAGDDRFNLSGANMNATLNAVATILVDGGKDNDTLNLGANGNYQAFVVRKNVETP